MIPFKPPKPRIRRVLAPLFMVVFFAILLGSAWHSINPNSFFNTFGFRNYLIAYTGSMEPDLKQNDLITVKKFSFDKLKVGDIITFMGKTNDGKKIPITHQVVQIIFDDVDLRTYVRTKGTNLPQPDLIPVTKDGVEGTNVYIGKLVSSSRILGNIIAYTATPLGMIVVNINLMCFVGIMFVINRLQNNANDINIGVYINE